MEDLKPGDRRAILVAEVSHWVIGSAANKVLQRCGRVRDACGRSYWVLIDDPRVVPDGLVIFECSDLKTVSDKLAWKWIQPDEAT